MQISNNLYVVPGVVANIYILIDEDGLTWEMERAAESMRKQAALDARIVFSGHGPVVVDAADKFPL